MNGKANGNIKHDHSHDHDHSHEHGHDHDHSHGIFSVHAHDHSEGADQIMEAIQKGKLDRGTKITLLGTLLSSPYGLDETEATQVSGLTSV